MTPMVRRLILVALAACLPSALAGEAGDVRARLSREEEVQKRAARQTDKALRELAAVLEAIQAHRLKPTGELTAAPAARDGLKKIDQESLPKLEKELYLARSGAGSPGELGKAVDAAARDQAELIRLLDAIRGQLDRASATGACLHRAERILRDQIDLDNQAKAALREGFGKQLAELVESLRRRLVGLSEEELRIGREVELLDGELAESEKTGPARQKPGIAAARKIIAEKKLAAAAGRVAEHLAVNNAAAAAAGQELETCFKALVAALQAATAGDEEVAPFDLLGPSLAELAAKDKELKELLDKLKAMIKEAQLLGKKPEREELRRLQNMQQELNNMLVEINRNVPDLDDQALIARLKELLQTALADMARGRAAGAAGDAGGALRPEAGRRPGQQQGDPRGHRPGPGAEARRQPDRGLRAGRGAQRRPEGARARAPGLGPAAPGAPRTAHPGGPRELPAGVRGPHRALLPEHRQGGQVGARPMPRPCAGETGS